MSDEFPELEQWSVSYETINAHGRFRIRQLPLPEPRWVMSRWDGNEWAFVTSGRSADEILTAAQYLFE